MRFYITLRFEEEVRNVLSWLIMADPVAKSTLEEVDSSDEELEKKTEKQKERAAKKKAKEDEKKKKKEGGSKWTMTAFTAPSGEKENAPSGSVEKDKKPRDPNKKTFGEKFKAAFTIKKKNADTGAGMFDSGRQAGSFQYPQSHEAAMNAMALESGINNPSGIINWRTDPVTRENVPPEPISNYGTRSFAPNHKYYKWDLLRADEAAKLNGNRNWLSSLEFSPDYLEGNRDYVPKPPFQFGIPWSPFLPSQPQQVEFYFHTPLKVTLQSLIDKYESIGRIPMKISHDILRSRLSRTVPGLLEDQALYHVLPYQIDILEQESSGFPVTLDVQITSHLPSKQIAGEEKTESYASWSNTGGVAIGNEGATDVTEDSFHYHHLVKRDSSKEFDQGKPAFKASSFINSADFSRFVNMDLESIRSKLADNIRSLNGPPVVLPDGSSVQNLWYFVPAPAEDQYKLNVDQDIQYLIISLWSQLRAIAQQRAGSDFGKSIPTMKEDGIRYLGVFKFDLDGLLANLETELAKSKRLMNLKDLTVWLRPEAGSIGWEEIKQKAATNFSNKVEELYPYFSIRLLFTFLPYSYLAHHKVL